MKPAISYIRFSTGKQKEGISEDRQESRAEEFCKRHGLVLNTNLTIRDLGKSAFRGKNAATGNLAKFIEAIRAGKVPKGTVLVVEALDRLTRNRVVEANHLLTTILTNGVNIGLVTEDKIYSLDYVNNNPFELLVATTYLIRGGDESGRKSDLQLKNWEAKRKHIRNGVAVKVPPPCWLRYKGEGDTARHGGRWEIIEERAAVVRRLFNSYLNSGLGIWALTHELNTEGVPVITSRAVEGSKWHRITIHRILTDRAAIGTYTNSDPHVEKYFPAIIEPSVFWAVQDKLKSKIRARGRGSLKDINLFKGLAKCSKCGATMTRITRTRGGVLEYRYLMCHNAVLGTCRQSTAVDLTRFEQAFLKYVIGSTTAQNFFGEKPVEDKYQVRLTAIETELADKELQKERLTNSIAQGAKQPKIIVDKINNLDADLQNLLNEKDVIMASLNSKARLTEDTMNFFFSRPKLDSIDAPDRLKLRELIRRFVTSLIIDPINREAKFTTLAGKTRVVTWEKTPRGRYKPIEER